jgi:hypothetical protein
MKKYFFLLFWYCTQAYGQEISNARWIFQDTNEYQFNLVPYWQKGDTKSYVMTTKENNYEGDSLMKSEVKRKSIAKFSVFDETDTDYTMQYDITKMLSKSSGETNDILDRYMNSNDASPGAMVLKYKISNIGEFDSYIEADKTIAELNKIFDLVVKSFSDEDRKMMESSKLRELFAGPALFKNIYNDVISNFHIFHGYKFGINDTLAFDQILPILNDTLIAANYIYINSVDTTTHEVEFINERYFDGDEFLRIIKAVVNENTLDDKITDESQFAINFYVRLTTFIDYTTGWPTFMKLSKETTTQEQGIEKTKQEVVIFDSQAEELKE